MTFAGTSFFVNKKVMKPKKQYPEFRYVPITVDKVFKLIFSEPVHKGILIRLLNILIPDKHIVDLKYLDKEHHGFVFSDKTTIFDVYCEADNGEQFVVEMQGRGQAAFADRSLFYSTYPLREQMMRRKQTILDRVSDLLKRTRPKIDYRLTPVYMVSITDFAMPHQSDVALEDGLVSRYSIRDDHCGELMTDALHFVYFEIGRLPYKIGEEGKCRTRLEKIAMAMRYMEEYREVPEALKDEILVGELFDASAVANMTLKQRKYYDRNCMETWIDKYAQLDYAEAEGYKKGLEQGIERGSSRSKVEIAIAMLTKGYDVSSIADITGLSDQEIKSLQ